MATRSTTLSVQIGTRSSGRFRGLLAGFRANVVRPEARIAQFAMDLEIFPAQPTSSSKK